MRAWILSFALLPTLLGAELFVPDYQEVLCRSKSEQKPVLLFFNGSDWSGLGMKMKREVFETPEFLEKTKATILCYEVDFPQHTSLDPALADHHAALKERYQITQLPALVLIGPDEHEIVRMGYFPASATELAADLNRLTSLDGQLQLRLCRLETLSAQELRETYEIALKLQHKEVLGSILEAGAHCDHPSFFLLEQYRYLMQQAQGDEQARAIKQRLFALDPNNQAGLLYDVAIIDFQSLATHTPPLAPEIVVKPLTDYLSHFGAQDGENGWRVEMMIAQFFLDQDYWHSALGHAEVAYDLSPVERQEEMGQLLDYIRAQSAQTVQN